MGAPGFWDDQQSAAQVSAEHSRTTRRLERWRGLASEVEDLQALAEMAEEDESVAAEVAGQMTGVEERLADARGGAAVLRALRRGRRAGHRQRRRRRHRRPGLGRDGAADDDALGRAPRAAGRAARGLAGGGGGHQVGDLPRHGRERLRALQRREGRAPARAPVALRRRPSPPDVVRRRRGRAGGRGRRRHRDRGRRPADRHLPRLGRRRPARQQDRLGRAHHPPARAGSSCSARTSARSRPTRTPR